MPTFIPHQLNRAVETAGTAIPLSATSVPARLIIIQANDGNTGSIFIGDADVSDSAYGLKITPGTAIPFGNDGSDLRFDLSQWYADASVSGEGFSILYI